MCVHISAPEIFESICANASNKCTCYNKGIMLGLSFHLYPYLVYAKALERRRICIGSDEPSLFYDNVNLLYWSIYYHLNGLNTDGSTLL